ncbi:hypothetical protein [Arthrobacter sp. NyZ413]|uniref:hypothetical protein n=1 Tax=Arthrobacter sp. NyZ413 TaxID=3144669 RepID=UPI003BF89AC6
MAIAVIMDFSGGKLEDYDKVVERIGLAPRGPGAAGGLFHWVAATEDGARIVDVWQTREQADEFYQNTLGPVTAELGIQPPEMSYFDVHNFQTAGPEA